MESIVFSIGFTAVSVYSSLITPPSMHATLQAMVQTIHYGIGKSSYVVSVAIAENCVKFGSRLYSVDGFGNSFYYTK